MRLDHIAYRVPDKEETANFLKNLFAYEEQERFEINFDDGSKANSIALIPPEKYLSDKDKICNLIPNAAPWLSYCLSSRDDESECVYHLAPEIFVSDGEPGSLIAKWVEGQGGTGGIHHIAYEMKELDNLTPMMEMWREKGIEFTTDKPIVCPEDDLEQIFTKPLPFLGGIIIELIIRGDKGFCLSSVKKLMESTK